MQESEKAEELKNKGNQLFKDGEYETAIRYYTNAIVSIFSLNFRKLTQIRLSIIQIEADAIKKSENFKNRLMMDKLLLKMI